jgi:hypothetical protein
VKKSSQNLVGREDLLFRDKPMKVIYWIRNCDLPWLLWLRKFVRKKVRGKNGIVKDADGLPAVGIFSKGLFVEE